MRLAQLLLIGLLPAGSAQSGQAGLTPEEIIERFAARESEFAEVWEHYTYNQTFIVEVLSDRDRVKEKMTIEMEIYFTADGERKMRILSERGALYSLSLTDEDIDDAVNLQPFALTREQLPSYKVDYEGVERVDELDTYVFDVKPKRIEKGKRYFEGRIWVDQLDLQIVRTVGKAVPDLGNNKFPRFETIRQQIDGHNWFPVWTHADDHLKFGSFLNRNTVHIRQWILYRDFQKFEVGTSIKFGEVTKPPR